jgi:LysM repeat protein
MQNTNNGCLPFTSRRLGIILLLIAGTWNLLTLAAANKAPASIVIFPAATRPAAYSASVTSSFAAVMVSDTPTPLLGPLGIPTQTQIATATPSLTPTSTQTTPAAVTRCTTWNHWTAHVVQWGDTLYTLADATGGTTEDLRRANCLSGDQIYPGQLLYLPRPAFRTALPTPGGLVLSTPTAAVADVMAVFRGRSAIIPLCYYPYSLYLDVQASDLQGTSSLTAFFSMNGGPLVEVPMALAGAEFHGQRAMLDWSPGAGTVYYYFKLVDGLGNGSYSSVDTAALVDCNGG